MHTPALPLRHRVHPAMPTTTVGSPRHEVRPPSLRHAPPSPWRRLVCWLMAPAPGDMSPPLKRLAAVREDFQHAVADLLQPQEAGDLVRRIELSRSLRELWHLRAEVYRLVALQHSQAEADARLASLNRHFLTRAPRSGFMPL